jgi:uncharacterized protein (TIGR02597 family)
MQSAFHARSLRLIPKLAVTITIGLITTVAGYKAAAQDVYTDPVGFITLTSTGNGYSFLGLSMTQIPAQRGLITSSAAGGKIAISGLTAGQYNTVLAGGVQVPAYYIEDLGSNSTFVGLSDDIVSNDATYIYTSTDDSSEILAGDSFKIYPHETLNSVFGTSNQNSIVYGSNTIAEADSIIVWNPVTQSSATYFYRSQGSIGWRGPAGPTTDAGNTPLYVDQDVEIQRKQVSGTNVNFLVVGAVKLGPTITSVPGGPGSYVFVGDMYATSLTLANLNLYTGNPTTGVYGSNTIAEADNVVIWNPTTQSSATYFYRSQGSIGWRGPQGPTTDASTNVFPLGSVIQIQHKTATPFNWTIPAQY